MPAEFWQRPDIQPHLAGLWTAFWELGTERQLGMTIGPIPMSKLREYLRDEMGLDGADYDRARSIIRMLDNAYLGMINRREEEPKGLSSSAKMTDPAGVKRVLDSLGSKAKAARPRKKTK